MKKLIEKVLGESFVNDDIKQKRLSVCDTCSKKNDDRCLVCSCFISIKSGMDFNYNPKKGLRLEKTHCPLGKWPYIDSEKVEHDTDIEIANFYRKKDGKTLLTF